MAWVSWVVFVSLQLTCKVVADKIEAHVMQVIEKVNVNQKLVAAGRIFLPIADLVRSCGVPLFVKHFSRRMLEERLAKERLWWEVGDGILEVHEPGEGGGKGGGELGRLWIRPVSHPIFPPPELLNGLLQELGEALVSSSRLAESDDTINFNVLGQGEVHGRKDCGNSTQRVSSDVNSSSWEVRHVGFDCRPNDILGNIIGVKETFVDFASLVAVLFAERVSSFEEVKIIDPIL